MLLVAAVLESLLGSKRNGERLGSTAAHRPAETGLEIQIPT
jgi:hypothetical protein